MTREEILKAIDEISADLKGPMTRLERALLVGDRNDYFAMLAEIDGTPPRKSPIDLRK